MKEILEKLQKSDKTLFVGVAGPGTGKSTAFKAIVESDQYKGKKILILSFINKLIDDLSNDFKSFSNVKVLTLHSFAKQVLGDIDIVEDLDSVISQDFSFIKNKVIDFEEKFYEDNLADDERDFYKERKKIYKNDKELYSFNSIIYAVNLFFRQKPEKIPSEYELILVDEFQDFNKSEFELIKLLNTKCKVLVVGDDDQSLYSNFRNAKPDQIRDLYKSSDNENFTLDFCYRCTRVIVKSVNDILAEAKNRGHLNSRIQDKKFLYPEDRQDNKNEISDKYPKIDFLSSVAGDRLIYILSEKIRKDFENEGKARILIITPGYLKNTIYDGLMKNGFNIVEFELFADEKSNNIKHRKLISLFGILKERKTDNLAIRRVLSLYLKDKQIKKVVVKSNTENKKMWYCLTDKIKKKIESDIDIYKKVKTGKKHLEHKELKRFNEIFNIKNVLSKMIKGFNSVSKGAIEVEMTTVMSSKGLSADLVYYLGIDDREMLDDQTNSITDNKLCEFLVGITRAKKKLTLISLIDSNPKILEFIDNTVLNKE